MVKHMIAVKVAVFWGEHCVDFKQAQGRYWGAYPLYFYEKWLRNETVREHYDAVRFSTDINRVFSRVLSGWASRMDVPRRGLDLPKKLIKTQKW